MNIYRKPNLPGKVTYPVTTVFMIITLTAIISLSGCMSFAAQAADQAAVQPAILELSVFDTPTAARWQVMENLQAGAKQFADREFSIKTLPEVCAGASFIHTAADSKKFSGSLLATFRVSADADVYIAHDTRIVIKPDWLASWENTGLTIVNTEPNPTSFGIFKKQFTANDLVELGNNGQSGGCIMYMVLVAPKGFRGKIDADALSRAGEPGSRIAIWPSCLGETDEWFRTSEAIRVGDNLIAFQRVTGAWDKNIDMAKPMDDSLRAFLAKEKNRTDDSTIDNNATTTQIRYLARLYTLTKQDRFRDAALLGLEYILKAQYPNGGWPQFYPLNTESYSSYITFNDNSMINVLELLERVNKDPSFAFVDPTIKERCIQAITKGRTALLQSQITLNGKKTAWCAQHYPDTLLPAPARAYELPSISGQESVGIVRYLMSIENPSADIIAAVQASIRWFDQARIDNIIVKEILDPALPGGRDKVVVPASGVPPVWARFYDLETGKPYFVGRDGVKKTTLAEIEYERRNGYSYYTNAPLVLLLQEYPAWQKRWVPKDNAVKSKY